MKQIYKVEKVNITHYGDFFHFQIIVNSYPVSAEAKNYNFNDIGMIIFYLTFKTVSFWLWQISFVVPLVF